MRRSAKNDLSNLVAIPPVIGCVFSVRIRAKLDELIRSACRVEFALYGLAGLPHCHQCAPRLHCSSKKGVGIAERSLYFN